MASIRRRIYAVIDIVLRIPPVFLVDSLLRNAATFDFSDRHTQEDLETLANGTIATDEAAQDYDYDVHTISKLVLTVAGNVFPCRNLFSYLS